MLLKFRNHFFFLLINIKVIPYHSYAGTEGRWRYGFHPFTTHNLALEGGGCSAPHTLAALCPQKRNELVPIVQEAGWVSRPVLTAQKISDLPGFDSQTVQFIMHHYTG